MPWIKDLQSLKDAHKMISMITCYDAIFAKIINSIPEIDAILVGDTISVTLYGFDATTHATIEMMQAHTAAVRRGAPDKLIIGDLPFGSFRKGTTFAFDAANQLICAGANAIKLENIRGHEAVVEHLVQSGIPVVGHLGLTPQSINQLGGYRVQGQTNSAQKRLIADAQSLNSLGISALVLECVPNILAKEISEQLPLPVIGIGTGPDVDGQVLVLPDLLGLNKFKAKFVKQYAELGAMSKAAITTYANEVKSKQFPTEMHSYA